MPSTRCGPDVSWQGACTAAQLGGCAFAIVANFCHCLLTAALCSSAHGVAGTPAVEMRLSSSACEHVRSGDVQSFAISCMAGISLHPMSFPVLLAHPVPC